MKNTIIKGFFKVLCLVIFCTSTTIVTAQHYKSLSQQEKKQKSIALIDKAECFILGTAVDSESFYGEDGKTIYTKIKIKVKHWYKGKGNRTIYLVRRGGVIGTDEQYMLHRSGPGLYLYKEYFMLLSKEGENYKFVRNAKASSGRYSDTRYDDFKIIAFYDMKFDSIDDLNQFVKPLQKIKVPKKKDVGFQKSSSEPPVEIDNIWLAAQGTFRAGTGEILTIKGQNFGTKGDILFMNASMPGTRMPRLENEYIVNWTPTEIRVIIPSYVRQGFSKGEYGTAGSGTIVVKRGSIFAQPMESTAKINIEYALLNRGTITNSEMDLSQFYLGREHCLNGLVFTLHENLMGNDEAIAAIEAALSAWANELGITLQLEEEEEGVYYYHNSTNLRNVIMFDPLLYVDTDEIDEGVEYTQMYTRPTFEFDSNKKLWNIGADIHIRPGILPSSSDVWNYSLSGDIDYDYGEDFYQIILHEIGHALGIGHNILLNADGTVNEKNLMYAYSRDGSAYSNDRTNLNQHSDKAKLAAQRITTDSRAHSWATDFFDLRGVETLAAFNNNSTVEPTPKIKVQNTPSPVCTGKTTIKNIVPFPFDNLYNYYWLPRKTEAPLLNVDLCSKINHPFGDKGHYYVRVKDAGCTVSSLYSLPFKIPVVQINPADRDNNRLATSESPEVLFEVYPNPTTGNLDIKMDIPETERSIYQIGIYDSIGTLQKQQEVYDVGLQNVSVDISKLPVGVYWVTWFADGEVVDTQQVQKID